jgi:pimeloyl-ACP methyl ester carboxylesterase
VDVRVRTDDGVELAVVEAGAGPPLLLVHGLGGSKEDLTEHFDTLARRARVVTFDHRGHGESDKPDSAAAYSFDRLAADTLMVANALGLDSFRLLGYSMGGMVARKLVLAVSERIDALVFMSTAAAPPPALDPDLVRAGAALAVEPDGMVQLRVLLDEADALGSEANRRLLAERPGYREFGDYKWNALSPVGWATLVVELVSQPDELERLHEVRCPTLVVVGTEDVTFLEPSRAIATAVPGAHLVEIPSAGHAPQFENPTAWLAAVEGFLHA